MATVDEILKLQEQQSSDIDEILSIQNGKIAPTNHVPQEEKPLIDVPYLRDISTPAQWYGGLKNIGYGPGKLVSHAFTPVLESVRGALRGTAQLAGLSPKYQSPEPNALAEFTEPGTGYGFGLPSSRATTANILTDVSNIMGIEQQPLAKVTSKDYPKLAEFAQQLTTPSVAGGVALDVALGKKTPTLSYEPNLLGMKVDELKMPYTKPELGMSLETAADYVRSLAKSPAQLLELEKTGKIYEIADMVRKQPEEYLHQFRHKKIYESIMGPVSKERGQRLYEEGGLSIVGKEQEEFINKLPTQGYSVPKEELQKSALAELNKTTMEAGQRSQAEEIIKRNIPIEQPSQEKLGKIRKIGDLATEYKTIRDTHPDEIQNPEYVETIDAATGSMVIPGLKPKTIPNQAKITRLAELKQQMIDLGAKDPHGSSPESYIERVRSINEEPAGYASTIRQLGNKLMEPPVPGETSTDVAAKNLAGRAMEKAARTYQDKIMGGPGLEDIDVQAYKERNRNISNMMIMRDLMEGNLVGDAYKDVEYVPTGVSGRSGAPSFIAKSLNRFIKPTASELSQGARGIAKTQAMMGREMIPAISPIQAKAMSRGLVENLADYEIPRSTSAILQNKDAVLAKIAQVTDNPQMVQMLDDALNKHPDKLEPVIQAISTQFPNLFTTDKYNRVDGKIFHPDPMMKQQLIHQAYEAVKNRDNLSNTEKAMLWNGLNKDGSLPDSFQ